MLDYSKVIQNSKAFQTIDLDISRSRLSHAYLFVSADENYLKQFAEMVSKKFININESQNIEKNNIVYPIQCKCLHILPIIHDSDFLDNYILYLDALLIF